MSEYVIHALTTLLVSLEPPGLAPIFIGLSVGMTPAERRKAAFGAATISITVLLCFAVLGDALLGFLGISLPAFRIAGGLLLFVIAYNMVFAKDEEVRAKPQVAAKHDAIQNIAIFPLAIPIIAGPGAISATIILGSKATNLYQHVALLVVVAAAIGTCLAVMLLANRIDRFLGETGRIIVSRLFGMILAALAMQFVVDGVTSLVPTAAAS
jgi:multiple antibiotic resistance protein